MAAMICSMLAACPGVRFGSSDLPVRPGMGVW
jgi:hypothetical protein